jgi:FlaA1/EpsC-like NDP-sugar epimerase
MSRSFPGTLFATVRFGNVLGSQGSVIPLFRRQIESGGPLIITHPEMRRFFMLIEEAVQLVLQSSVMCGEPVSNGLHNLNTFVLEMGRPIAIVDVAQKMLDFYWKDQNRSIGVEFSGLRPGEKLDEALTWTLERITETEHPLIKRVCVDGDESVFDEELALFEKRLPQLLAMASEDSTPESVVDALARAVPGFTPLNLKPVKNIVLPDPGTVIVHSPLSVRRLVGGQTRD